MPSDAGESGSDDEHPLKVTSPRLEQDEFKLTPSGRPDRGDARRIEQDTKSPRAGPDPTKTIEDETEQGSLIPHGGSTDE